MNMVGREREGDRDVRKQSMKRINEAIDEEKSFFKAFGCG